MLSWKLVAYVTGLVTLSALLFTFFFRSFDIGHLPTIGFDPKVNKISLEEMDIDDLKYLLHSMLSKSVKVCNTTEFFGRTSADGGYSVCMDGPLRPVPGSCTVLSFGINNEWSFDEAIANKSCEVISFDPSMGMKDHLHKKNIQFYNTGLGKTNEINNQKWKMRNIMTILKDLGKTDQVIDVIKCDAEGAEWPFLEDLAQNKIKVKQVVLEIHSLKRNPQVLTKEDVIYMISIFHQLRKSGYIIWHNKQINYCCSVFSRMMPPGVNEKCCYEIFIYNSRYL